MQARLPRQKRVSGRPIRPRADATACAIGHEDRLEHVIGHLVQNALDAARRPAGDVSVRISRDEGDSRDRRVRGHWQPA